MGKATGGLVQHAISKRRELNSKLEVQLYFVAIAFSLHIFLQFNFTKKAIA